jgi:methyl-accepting chemotaxis protein
MDIQLDTLRESFRRLIPRSDALAQRFYDTLFERHPETLALFEGVCFDDQKRKLVRALALVVRHMEHPDFLRAYLQGLGAIHVAYGVEPAHYPMVSACLLDALAATAGAGWSANEEAAWKGAFTLITEAMLEGTARLG